MKDLQGEKFDQLRSLGAEIEDDINPVITKLIESLRDNPKEARRIALLGIKLTTDSAPLTDQELTLTKALAGTLIFKLLYKTVQV